MSEPRAHTPDDSDATLVTPRFDEEETVLAQPVVPLDAPDELPPGAPAAYAPRAYAARRQWPLALILASALVGSVLGGAGLYFFQKHRRSNAAPAEVTQPSPAPTVEQAAEAPSELSAPPVESEPTAEVIAAEEAPAEEPAAAPEEQPDEKVDDDDRDAERAERAPAPAPAREDTTKRGKKGERDDDGEHRERRSPPARSAPAEPERDERNEARRVDSIIYPSRRAERRAERQAERRARRAARSVDRVRAIFEGQPE